MCALINLRGRVKGNALTITVIVSLVVSIFISSLLLRVYYQMYRIKVFEREAKLRNNLSSGINSLLADTKTVRGASTIDLGEGQAAQIETKIWGVLGKGFVKASVGDGFIKRNFFYGSALLDSLGGCLYLADHKRQLSLVGKTNLIGDAFLPDKGLVAGYLGQRSFEGSSYINGRQVLSKEGLPFISLNIVEELGKTIKQGHLSKIGLQESPDSIFRSFDAASLVFADQEPLLLKKKRIKGQVIIQSAIRIEVGADCYLENVILFAPVIKLQKGFTGILQAIATDSLIVGENCHLDYPSSLILQKRKAEIDQPFLQIGSQSSILGSVISVCEQQDPLKTLVEVKAEVKVDGLLYVNGFLDLKSDVNGIVATDFFINRSGSSIWENLLLDIEINRQNLSRHFIGPVIFQQNKPRGIVQWLD